jgi:hypothetical protein
LVFIACVSVLIVHTRLYPRFFFDDSFISLRYSDRFRHGLGLTWTDGERVEGYSNLLWVVLVAIAGLFTDELVNVARVLGVASTSLTILALVWGHASRHAKYTLAPLYAGLALALTGPVVAWSVGGLEAPLLMCLVCWAIVLCFPLAGEAVGHSWRQLWRPSALLGLAALTRPDGVSFAFAVAFGLLVARKLRWAAWRDAVKLLALPVTLFALQLVFRKLYYGAWLPNTSTKLAWSTERIEAGWNYVTRDWQTFAGLWAPCIFALFGLPFSRRLRRHALLILPALLGWTAYVVLIGGDFMPQRRHLVPGLGLMALLAAEGLRVLVSYRQVAVLALAPLGLFHLYRTQTSGFPVDDANNAAWYWEGRPIGQFFRSAFGEHDPLLAVDAAGSLPYFSRLRSLDMLGLNDRYIATHPPKDLGRGSLAHELGDGKYVMSRKPDLVVFHLPIGRSAPMWRSGREMVRHRDWAKYRLVHYETPRDALKGMVWVRAEDGPLGVQKRGRELVIPGYLFGQAQTPATLDPQRRPAVRIPRGQATHQSFELPPGVWKGRIEGTCPGEVQVASARLDAKGPSKRRVNVTTGASGRGVCFVQSVVLTPG